MSTPNGCDHPADRLEPLDDDRILCNRCGETLAMSPGVLDALVPAGAAVALHDAATIEQLLSVRSMPVVQWAKALLDMGEFEDSPGANPGLDMIAAILGAETSAEALAATNMQTVNDLIGDKPGAHSALLEITAASPLKSGFDEGPSCFTVVSATIVATGEQIKFSCGGRTVQAVILAHVNRGWLPFRCILTRRLKATRAGYYPLNLEAGG